MKFNNKMLADLIKEKGCNILNLSARAGIPQPTLQGIVKGKSKRPGFLHIVKIMRALDIWDFEELVIDDD